MIIKGKAWTSREYIMSFDMVVQRFWTSPIDKTENAKFIMAGVDAKYDRENAFKDEGYTFIVAAHNFAGGGKSIEHCVTGLMGAGIQTVFADSFARLQFRNAINYGLPFVTAKNVIDMVETGDELEYNLETCELKNLTNGQSMMTAPVAPFVAEVAKAGGLMDFIRQKIKDGTVGELR
ncbi:MAG: 3-isopropylmalate dehydratase [Cytophagia bacterium]|jgi:3-isopropylmalate/(R)-2-methylmalate dehydratase small subunit|nr:MAG: 3-isopropylmalate dehydratase [Runella sp.]TAG19794.1 MAG: 3-isopropylmalate dehydratase [Cytophagales bacterium]TAG39411.1 MAG: 3-isopropylmalate dehydratase [Cytophagia bacterium]TAG80598.1 MAG: 3-isopropylmalate dehydratase [Cytophagales bacterium]